MKTHAVFAHLRVSNHAPIDTRAIIGNPTESSSFIEPRTAESFENFNPERISLLLSLSVHLRLHEISRDLDSSKVPSPIEDRAASTLDCSHFRRDPRIERSLIVSEPREIKVGGSSVLNLRWLYDVARLPVSQRNVRHYAWYRPNEQGDRSGRNACRIAARNVRATDQLQHRLHVHAHAFARNASACHRVQRLQSAYAVAGIMRSAIRGVNFPNCESSTRIFPSGRRKKKKNKRNSIPAQPFPPFRVSFVLEFSKA